MLGAEYCAALPNSTGASAALAVTGSRSVASTDLVLTGTGCPTGRFAVMAAGRQQALVTPAGASGQLCIGADLTLVLGSGGPVRTDASGGFRARIDSRALPTPGGDVAATVGETWSFQGWVRDVATLPTSNFTSAVEVQFVQ